MADHLSVSRRIEEAVEKIDENMQSVGEEGQAYFESVREKLVGIDETISRTLRVSANQLNAVNNMIGGVERWLEPHER